ncbi:MAG: photosynthetic complex putative assembly protein PuhB [Pseudomonadota bacterium]
MSSDDDFAFEPTPGLPEELPEGETILWQGRPVWTSLAKRAFFLRPLAAYFAVLAIWRIYDGVMADQAGLAIVGQVAALLPAFLAAALVLGLLARAYAKSTIYTLTNRRVVMRYGVALPMTINLPFSAVNGAGIKVHADQTGDIPLQLTNQCHIAYLHLWPNARPWCFSNTEPMLRAVAQPAAVAKVLSQALAAHTTNQHTQEADMGATSVSATLAQPGTRSPAKPASQADRQGRPSPNPDLQLPGGAIVPAE